jgi:transposase-like protein
MKEHEIRTPITRDGRRQFTVWQKRLILREHVEQGTSITYLARKYQVHPVTIYGWKRMVDLSAEMKDPHASVDELLRELDQLRRENDRLRLAVADLVVEKAVQGDVIDAFQKREQNEKFEKLRKKSSPQVTPSGGSAPLQESPGKPSTALAKAGR